MATVSFRRRVARPGLLVLASCVWGCGGVDPDAQALAENGSDVTDVASRLSALTATFALGADHEVNLAAIASTSTLYAPEGCATTRMTGGAGAESITFTFADCSGPWGLVHLSGELTVGPPQGSAPPGVLELRATGLKLGRASVDYTAEATIRSDGAAARSLTWSPSLSGKTARGRAFQSEGSWTARWTVGGTCIEANSAGDQAIVDGSPLVINEASDLTRCSSNCPTGGRVVISNASSLSDTVVFGGQDVAVYVTTSGSNDIQLACGL